MIAYKGFRKGLICRDYKFTPGKTHKTSEANCARNGFHAAENPLDVFSYYPDIENSEYWMVKCEGDIHEDGLDSKIACTEIKLIKKLSLAEMAGAALIYLQKHPKRKTTNHFANEAFKIFKNKNPILSGEKGQWLGFAQCNNENIVKINLIHIDGKYYFPNVKYNVDGMEVR